MICFLPKILSLKRKNKKLKFINGNFIGGNPGGLHQVFYQNGKEVSGPRYQVKDQSLAG